VDAAFGSLKSLSSGAVRLRDSTLARISDRRARPFLGRTQ
jgi:hypothetical protein